MKDIFTIGHSTLSEKDFHNLLQVHEITCLVDVRRYPGSRRSPHFNKEHLQNSLPIKYVHLPALGGRRTDPQISNTVWRVKSFASYESHMRSEEFLRGISTLIQLPGKVAIMCSEACHWKCHRRMISDYLLADGYNVFHICSQSKIMAHALPDFATIENNRLVYKNKIEEK